MDLCNKPVSKEVVSLAFEKVVREIELLGEDQVFWWNATAHSLGSLLRTSHYSEDAQISYLRWFYQWIIPALGPRPVRGRPQHESCLVFDGSICEYSINWKEKQPHQTVRLTIEPTGFEAGTTADPFNQQATKNILIQMAKDIPGIDLRQFEHLASEIFLPNEAAVSLLPTLPVSIPRSRAWAAFDLDHGKTMVKAYFIPLLKSIQTGVKTKTLVFDAITTPLHKRSIAQINGYLESFPAEQEPSVSLVAIDCTYSPDARVKVYLQTTVNTLAKAKSMFTLGGRLSGPIIEAGQKALSELWCHIFTLSTEDSEDKEVLTDSPYCGFAFEMKVARGDSMLEPKIYIPLWRLGKTDSQLCEKLSSWFKIHGHDDFAARYKQDLVSAL